MNRDAVQTAILRTVEGSLKPIGHRGVFERLPGFASLHRVAMNMVAMERIGLLKLLPPTKGLWINGEEKLYTV
jgi:hypothetical protein